MEPSKLTDTWFSRVKDGFAVATSRFVGRQITYLEIGSWGGASAEFVAQNVLTHPKAIGIAIDPYPPTRICEDMEGLKALAARRVSHLGDHWTWIYDLSSTGLRIVQASGCTLDLVYIDGCHAGNAVMQDFLGVWPMLKKGSVVIFDDYWHRRASTELWPHVRDAVVGIQLAFAGMLVPVPGLDKRQIGFEVVRKTLPPIHDREDAMRQMPAEVLESQAKIRKELNHL